MLGRSESDIAAELYGRGFTLTREEADRLVHDEPDVVDRLLHTHYPLTIEPLEMTHREDRAGREEWGGLG